MKFKTKVVWIVILVSLVLTGLVVAQVQTKRVQFQRRAVAKNSFGQKEQELLRQKSDEPTPIQEGMSTEKQKQHGKLFKGYADTTGGKKIRDLVGERGDVELGREIGDVMIPSSFNLHNYLQRLSCQADAIIAGTVKSKSSQLTEDGSFLFTDYEIVPENILKTNSATPIVVNNVITVTRTGGAVKLNGHTVRAVDYSQKPLIIGDQYLLFLRFIPATGAYTYVSNWGEDSFKIQGTQIAQVSGSPLPLGTRRTSDAASFISEVQTAVANVCGN